MSVGGEEFTAANSAVFLYSDVRGHFVHQSGENILNQPQPLNSVYLTKLQETDGQG